MPPKGVPLSTEHRANISAAKTKPVPAEKRCPACGDTKPADAFGRLGKPRRGLRSYCKRCESASYTRQRERNPEAVRERERLRAFKRRGVTEQEFQIILDRQGGRCAICGTSGNGTATDADCRLFVDHCHDTGGVRGLLCRRCNTGLGMFADRTDLLSAAASYLEAHRTVAR